VWCRSSTMVLASIWMSITGDEPSGGALYGSEDGPRLCVERSTTSAQERLLPCMLLNGPRLGGTMSGRRVLGVVLGSVGCPRRL
jgi:hypothetical protein